MYICMRAFVTHRSDSLSSHEKKTEKICLLSATEKCQCQCWITKWRRQRVPHYSLWVTLDVMASTCDFHEKKTASKLMPSNFTELTRSMWPAESWKCGRCGVLDGGPIIIFFVLKLTTMSLLLTQTWSWWKKRSILVGWFWTQRGSVKVVLSIYLWIRFLH